MRAGMRKSYIADLRFFQVENRPNTDSLHKSVTIESKILSAASEAIAFYSQKVIGYSGVDKLKEL